MLAGKNLILNYYINQTMLKKLKKYSIYGILPLAVLALFITNTASAHGWGWGKNIDPQELAQRQQEMFQEQADLLGTTTDKVKDSWAKGQTLADLAGELGISETDLQAKLKANRLAELKTNLQTLVTQGIISQAQADQRYNFMAEHIGNAAPGKHMGRMMFGGWGRHGP